MVGTEAVTLLATVVELRRPADEISSRAEDPAVQNRPCQSGNGGGFQSFSDRLLNVTAACLLAATSVSRSSLRSSFAGLQRIRRSPLFFSLSATMLEAKLLICVYHPNNRFCADSTKWSVRG